MTPNLIEQARRAALELTADITTGSDWPNTPEEIGRLNTAHLLRQLAAALEQRAEGVGDKPCLVSGECKHGNWCSDVYCQEHCRFVRELDQLDALAELCDEATGGWDLPPHAVRRIGALARKARAALAQQARPQPLTETQVYALQCSQPDGQWMDEEAAANFEAGVRAAERAHGIGGTHE